MRAGTIVASNYSAMADVLGRSFLEQHPESSFTVLVVDDSSCTFSDGIETARLDDLDIAPAALDVMRSIYDVMEFSTSVKASFLRLLLDGWPHDDAIACYLDPDIVVHAPFDDRVAPALDHGVVLTPHVLEPVPRDGKHVQEGTIMQSGMFNCGFLAVAESGRPFLDWWDQRLRFDAVVDFERSHFTDQRWVDWVPSLFDHVICRDPGMNVAWWNIHERQVDADPAAAAGPTTGGRPIRFVHFSGYDPVRPDTLSRFQADAPRVAHAAGTGMRALADDYAERLAAAGHDERKQIPYRWGVSIDGIELTADVRRRIRTAILSEVGEAGVEAPGRTTPDAFGGGDQSLGDWLQTERARTGSDSPGATATDPPSAPVPVGDAPQPPALPGSTSAGIGMVPGLVERGHDMIRRMRSASDRLAERFPPDSGASRSPHPTEPGAVRPFAFLHVPKSAGSSITAALRDAMPRHTWGDYVFDPAWMGPYRDAPRPAVLRHQVLESSTQLDAVDAVAGHLLLDTLLQRFDIGDIATVVREPRSRLLSHYEYWRGLDDAARRAELPWESSRSATRLDFAEWLLDESIAYQSDNNLIRQLVSDPAIPPNGFIANGQLNRLARLATARVRRLGWVGIVERGAVTWESLSGFIGAPLHQRRINVTERNPSLAVDLDAVFARSVPALAARTAGDAIVWQAAARRTGVDNPVVAADAAWMRRLGAAVRAVTPPAPPS